MDWIAVGKYLLAGAFTIGMVTLSVRNSLHEHRERMRRSCTPAPIVYADFEREQLREMAQRDPRYRKMLYDRHPETR